MRSPSRDGPSKHHTRASSLQTGDLRSILRSPSRGVRSQHHTRARSLQIGPSKQFSISLTAEVSFIYLQIADKTPHLPTHPSYHGGTYGTHKNLYIYIYIAIFTNIWSYLLWSPVIFLPQATHLEDDVVVVHGNAGLRVDGVGETRQLVDVAQPPGVGGVHARRLADVAGRRKPSEREDKTDESVVQQQKRTNDL